MEILIFFVTIKGYASSNIEHGTSSLIAIDERLLAPGPATTTDVFDYPRTSERNSTLTLSGGGKGGTTIYLDTNYRYSYYYKKVISEFGGKEATPKGGQRRGR